MQACKLINSKTISQPIQKTVCVLSGGGETLEKKRIKIHQMIWKWRISFHKKTLIFFILYYNILCNNAPFIDVFSFIPSFCFPLALSRLFLRTHYFFYIYSHACFCLLTVPILAALHSEGFYISRERNMASDSQIVLAASRFEETAVHLR